MAAFDNFLTQRLSRRKEEGLFRSLRNESHLVDFCSNDYLGFARSQELAELIRKKTEAYMLPNGATGSRLISGNFMLTEQLEHRLAGIFSAEASLIFNSGYTANVAVLSSLPQKGDTILYDELVHASMKDGARLSLATRHPFRHNDLHDLENKIRKSTGRLYIAVESVYSMDGDQCPLKELVSLSEKYDATIILDEAHSTGIFGKSGSGIAVSQQLTDHIPVRIYTFGKAMGVHGACVAGSNNLRNFLINFARPFIYSTALPPHNLVAIESAFTWLEEHHELQKVLSEKIKLFTERTSALKSRMSDTPIQTVLFNGNENAKEAANSFQSAGYDVRPILYPTVPKTKERLRICIHSFNTSDQIIDMTRTLVDLRPSTHKESAKDQ